MAQIEAAIPPEAVAGTRYDAHQMQVLDSENRAKGRGRVEDAGTGNARLR